MPAHKTYYLGIGSNINRIVNINSCLWHIKCAFSSMLVSPTYQSPAFGFEGEDFYNLVVKINSAFEPHALKHWIQKLEDLHGRNRNSPRYSNRSLDIDLLLCDDRIIDDGHIQIPRSEILKRKYVLKPLQDLSPELVHPITKKRLAEMWQALDLVDNTKLIEVSINQ